MSKERFGEFVRRKRMEREIGLREMAKLIDVSPTYLSKIERDEFPPPAEDKVRAISEVIDWNADELLARAGRVSQDLTEIIKSHPVEIAALLRAPVDWSRLNVEELVHTKHVRESQAKRSSRSRLRK